MKAQSIHRAILAWALATSLAAGESIVLMPGLIDFGEIPVNGSSVREFSVSNATDQIVIFDWMEADSGVTVQFYADMIRPHKRFDGCVCMTAGGESGIFTNELVFVLGGFSNETVGLRLVHKVVEGDPGLFYPDAGFAKVDEPSTMGGDRRMVWRCYKRTQAVMDALHKTNPLERADSLLEIIGPKSFLGDDTLDNLAAAEMNKALKMVFDEAYCGDDERDRTYDNGKFRFNHIGFDIMQLANGYKFRKENAVRLREEEKAREEAERKKQEEQAKRAEEERIRQEERARREEAERKRQEEQAREQAWFRAGLPGERPAKVWEEYLADDGAAFADAVYFKTNVFLPFLVKEFAVDKEANEELKKKIMEIMEHDIADPLCHIGISHENLVDCHGEGLCGDSFEPTSKWAHEYYLETESRNPFILAILVFHDLPVMYRFTDNFGVKRKGQGYELSEDCIPEGRDGLATQFVRNLRKYPGNRYYANLESRSRFDRCTPTVAWCKTLEEEGARPEHWRCVMLLALRVMGTYLAEEGTGGYRELANALEKAGCAPVLVRMLREEPALQ